MLKTDWINRTLFSGMGRVASAMLLLVFIGSVGLDQVTKIHAHEELLIWEDPSNDDLFRGKKIPVFMLGERVFKEGKRQSFVGLNWQYSRNKGAAFSMFANLPDVARVPLFYAITLFAVIFIGYFFMTTQIEQHLMRYGLALILAGAIGNFLDRLFRGYVVDFIDVDWNIALFDWHVDFAIFNVADVSINIGVYCMLIQMGHEYFRDRKKGKKDLGSKKEKSAASA